MKVEVAMIALAVRSAPRFVTQRRQSVAYKVMLNATCPVLTLKVK